MENQFSNYSDKIGILLTNLGTPDSPTPKSLRKYLNQFLMDQRVVDLPRALWVPILKLIILNIRPKKSAKLYDKIWTEEGSPLLAISKTASLFFNFVSFFAFITTDFTCSFIVLFIPVLYP